MYRCNEKDESGKVRTILGENWSSDEVFKLK